MNTNGFSRTQILLRIRRNVGALVGSPQGTRALILLVLLVSLLLVINGLNVLNSYVGRDFMSAIEHKNRAQFVVKAWLYIGVFALSTIAAVFYRFCEERLGLLWRNWQTRFLLDRYLALRAYYRVEEEGTLPNPDQRIADDVHSFATLTLSFLLMTLNSTFTIVAFSSVLWSISPHLFVVAVVYALCGSLTTAWLGRRLIGLNVAQLDKEANFRAELIHLRENAESVAVLHREEGVRRRLLERLQAVVDNTRRIINVNRNLGFFTNGYNYLIQIMPALIVAPLFMRGDVEFGVITQSAMAFALLMGAFSLVVTQFQSFSSYAAVITRIGKLVDAIDRAEQPQQSPIEIVDTDGRLIYEHLTLRHSDGQLLLDDLNLTIERGSRVLITSTTAYARLALFKATAGLYVDGSGRITRPDAGTLLFLPDRPYLPKCSLRELLLDGMRDGSVSETELREALRHVELERLADDSSGFNGERDWAHSLGSGEQSMLMLARVLLSRPQFVFLDRSGSGDDPVQAEQCLMLLSAQGIGYVVLGRADDSTELFDAHLRVAGDGRWYWRVLNAEGALPDLGTVGL